MIARRFVMLAIVAASLSAATATTTRPPTEIRRGSESPIIVGGARDADPVDLGTGLYIRPSYDFVVIDVLPIYFKRVYDSGDTRSRAFGIGTSNSYELFLAGDMQQINLILEDGATIKYPRVSPGTTHVGSVFEHWTTPTAWYGSRLAWVADHWEIELPNGAVYHFRACGPSTMVWQGQCALIYYRDWYGNTVRLTRDADGHLLKIETTNGRWLRLQHDEAHRVTRGWDSTGRSMSYEYDAAGRLVRAIASTGEVQAYEYDAAHKMTRIVERHGTVISNAYDAAGRTIGQVVEYPPEQPGSVPPPAETFGFRYGTNGRRITDVEVTRSDGTRRSLMFNVAGYTITEQVTSSDGLVTTTTYLRDGASNIVDGVQVACTLPSGAATSFQARTGPGMRTDRVAATLGRECRTPFIPDGSP